MEMATPVGADKEATFRHAAEHSADPKRGGAAGYSNQTKLDLYAYYKQAVDGDIPAGKPKPSAFLDFMGRTKHDAWEKLKGMSKKEAMLKYIDTISEADPGFVQADRARAGANKEEAGKTKTEGMLVVANNNRPDPPPVPHNPQQNVMIVPALVGCGIMTGLGLAGFLFVTLSWSALAFLLLALAGIGGFIGALVLAFDERGLLGFIPFAAFLRKCLLDVTLLEFLLDDSLLREFKELMAQLLPVFLAHDEERMLEALSNMSPWLRQMLTTKGMIHLLSPGTQQLLLPRAIRNQVMAQQPYYRLPQNMGTSHPEVIRQEITRGSPDDKPDLDSARALFRQLFSEVMSKKNVEFVLGVLDGHRLQTFAVGLGLMSCAQLVASSENRKFLFGFVRGVALLGSLSGAGISAALLVLYMGAKHQKKRKGW